MATQKHGPFDRLLRAAEPPSNGEPAERDRAAVYVGGTIIGLALLLLILVLPPISILSGDGGGAEGIPAGPGTSDSYTSKIRSGVPKLPAGLVAASSLFDLSAPEDQRGASGLTIPLKEQETDARDMALYTYVEEKWQRLSDVTLVAGGSAVRGEVDALPGNVIVLKRSATLLQVAGSIPAGTTLDPAAEGVLTTLHPIVFIPVDDGTIIGQPPAVPPASYRVVPSVVAPAPAVVDDILRTDETRAAHVTGIASAVTEGNFAGINVDYRGVNPALRDQFSAFVEALAQALRQDGRTLTLTLPMPVIDGASVDTGAYDWERLGAAADSIELAPELDQDLYFQRTEAALDYIVERVDRGKILITITTLSVERGGDGLRVMSYEDALAIASQVTVKHEGDIAPNTAVPLVAQNLAQSEGGTGLQWDDVARSVTFTYPGRAGRRTVWIANQFSAAFRLELAQRYNLGGVAFTDVSTEAGGANVWAAVQEISDTGSVSLVKPNGELFTPVWLAVNGALDQTRGDSVTWTSPGEPGPYEVAILISDGIARAANRITITVAEPPDE